MKFWWHICCFFWHQLRPQRDDSQIQHYSPLDQGEILDPAGSSAKGLRFDGPSCPVHWQGYLGRRLATGSPASIPVLYIQVEFNSIYIYIKSIDSKDFGWFSDASHHLTLKLGFKSLEFSGCENRQVAVDSLDESLIAEVTIRSKWETTWKKEANCIWTKVIHQRNWLNHISQWFAHLQAIFG